jgi:hypothetical protein
MRIAFHVLARLCWCYVKQVIMYLCWWELRFMFMRGSAGGVMLNTQTRNSVDENYVFMLMWGSAGGVLLAKEIRISMGEPFSYEAQLRSCSHSVWQVSCFQPYYCNVFVCTFGNIYLFCYLEPYCFINWSTQRADPVASIHSPSPASLEC